MRGNFFVTLILLVTFAGGIVWAVKYNQIPLTIKQQKAQALKVETLFLKGSNTVGESFAPRLAQAYLRSRGGILINTISLEDPVEKIVEGVIPDEDKMIRIDIRAHGSTTGFKALEKQSAEIAMSSRAIKSEERVTLSSVFGEIVEHPIALDALAIVTYPDNPLNTLTISQIAGIFSGEIKNWSQVGGENQRIHLLSRDNNSGTWDTFNSLVLKPRKLKLHEDSKRHESSAELVASVVNTRGALGFVGVAYAGEAKLLKVAANANEPGTRPSGYTIGTQAYPLSRKLYFYTAGRKNSPLAKSFIQFVTQNEGQKEANNAGLISYYPTHYRPVKLDKATPIRYRELATIGRRITVNFSSGGTKIDEDKETRDLQRLRNFALENPGRMIVLVDFSDSPRLAEIKNRLEQNQISVLDTLTIHYPPLNANNIEVWVI